MNIRVRTIERIDRSRSNVLIELGNDVVSASLTHLDDPEIEGFNFDEEFFDVLFAHNGLGAMFNRDYTAFIGGTKREFPWDYGEHNPELITRASEKSGVSMTQLKTARNGG